MKKLFINALFLLSLIFIVSCEPQATLPIEKDEAKSATEQGNISKKPSEDKKDIISDSDGDLTYSNRQYDFISYPQSLPSFTQLPSALVNDVLKTEDGTLYVATRAGLAISYDNGATYQTKRVTDGLPSNNISSIHLNSQGKMYVMAGGMLAYSTDKGKHFTKVTSSFTASDNMGGVFPLQKLCLLIGQGDIFYMGTSAGVYVSRDGGMTFNGVTNTDMYVYSIFQTPDGKVYTGGTHFYVSTNHGQSFNKKLANGRDGIWIIGVSSTGDIYANIGYKLFISKNGGESFVNSGYSPSGPQKKPVSMTETFVDGNNTVYIAFSRRNQYGTAMVVKSVNGGDFEKIDDYSTSENIRKLVTDSSHNLYVVQTAQGFQVQAPGASSFTHYSSSFTPRSSLNIVKDSKGRIFSVFKDDNITIFDQNGKILKKLLSGKHPRGGMVYHNGKIYVSTDQGLYVIDESNDQVSRLGSFIYLHDVQMIDDVLYVLGGYGLYVSSDYGQSFSFFQVLSEPEGRNTSTYLRRMFVEKNGLVYVTGQKTHSINPSTGVVKHNIPFYSMGTFQDSTGVIYGADLYGYLYKSLDHGATFTKHTSQLDEEMPHYWDGHRYRCNVQQITINAAGQLCMATSWGLYCSMSDGSFKRYTAADGLPTNNINYLFSDKDTGKTYISTSGGLAVSSSELENIEDPNQ